MPAATEVDSASLAQLLRECASIIEEDSRGAQNAPSSSGLLYRALEALHLYTEKSLNSDVPGVATSSGTHNKENQASATAVLTRPSFQRPTNKKSNLIANGWVLQQRRSKLRVVWKEVLASLVEARRPGEETTLWIQRESVDMASAGTSKGKKVLQALHQIPMKWLMDVKLLDFYGDFRFSIKIFNVDEDFVFRTADEGSCRQWVATLKSAKEARGGKTVSSPSSVDSGGGSNSIGGSGSTEFPDLLGGKQEVKTTKDPGFPDLDMASGNPEPSVPPMNTRSKRENSNNRSAEYPSTQTTSSPKKERKSIKELRAIAHAEGYDTRGMERSDLEKIADYYAPVSVKNELYRKQQQQQQQQQRTSTSKPSASNSKVDEQRMAAEAENIRKRQEEQRIKQQQEYVRKQLEEAKKREEELKKQTEAAKRREEEEKRQKQQRQQQQQQRQRQNQNQKQTWNNGHGGSTPRRHPQSATYTFESTRFFDTSNKGGVSGPRRKHPNPPPFTSANNKFPSQAQQRQHSSQPDPPTAASSAPPQQSFPQHKQHPHASYQNHQQQPQQPQPQQQHRPHHHSQPPPPQPTTPPGTNDARSADPTSPLNQKYAKAMKTNQDSNGADGDQAAIASIKRDILITWALVPPQYNMLRPIDYLISTIQQVFPPFSNVANHEYFSKWNPIVQGDLSLSSAMGNTPDEAKLKKAVRKLRVLLHPDRLPKDFDKKQHFVCKMLWDVSNDAYEEFLKQKDDLDWVNK